MSSGNLGGHTSPQSSRRELKTDICTFVQEKKIPRDKYRDKQTEEAYSQIGVDLLIKKGYIEGETLGTLHNKRAYRGGYKRTNPK